MLKTLIPLAALAVACGPSSLDVGTDGELLASGDSLHDYQAVSQPLDTTAARGGVTGAEAEAEVEPTDDEDCELHFGYFVGAYGGGHWEGDFTDLSNNWLADARGTYEGDLSWEGEIASGDLGGTVAGDWGHKVFKGDIAFDGVTDAVVSGGFEGGEFAGLWTACI